MKIFCEGCEEEIVEDEIYIVDHEMTFCDYDCFIEFVLNQYASTYYKSRIEYIKEVEAQ